MLKTAVTPVLVYFSLGKPRILVLVVITSLTSAVVASQGSLAPPLGVLLALSVSLAAAGAAFLNNYFDRNIDAIMERTKSRPLPNNVISPFKAFAAGIVLIAIAVPFSLLLNYLVALFIIGGALIYGLLYTLWLKRRTSLNIVIGGMSGSCAVLAGWFTITSQVLAFPLLAALLVFLWTPSHFWSLAIAHVESYRKANVPMLPVLAGTTRTIHMILLSTGLVLLVSLLIYLASPLHEIYLISSLLLGSLFLWSNIRLWQQPTAARAWLNFKLSGAYLLGLFLAVILDTVIFS